MKKALLNQIIVVICILLSSCSMVDNKNISDGKPNEKEPTSIVVSNSNDIGVSQNIEQESKGYFLITTGNTLLGGYLGDDWITPEESEHYVESSEKYTFYSFNRMIGTGTNAKIVNYEGENAIELERDYTPSYSTDEFYKYFMEEVSTTAEWKLLPRIPTVQTSNIDVYEKVVREVLHSKGIEAKSSVIKVIRIDLDGNGTEEVLLCATDWDLDSWLSSGMKEGKGTYSFILLRKISDNKVENIIVREQYSKDNPEYEYVYYTPFILDFDNDGNMEVVVEGRFGAWSRVEIIEVNDMNIRELYSTDFGA